MFEKRPIWGIILGLNVCVLIWLISVQEPVMYDASTAIISSGSGSNKNLQLQGGGVGVTLSQRGNRDDRDVNNRQSPQYSGKHLLTNNISAIKNSQNDMDSTLTTLNVSNDGSTASDKSLQSRVEPLIKSTTNVIYSAADIHSLTSSLGTGVVDVKFRTTPSWIKLTAVSSALPYEDFNRLIDLDHFHYLVPQPVCSSEIEALILVHSAPRNHEKRQIIRETWASIGRHVIDSPIRVLFLLGAVNEEQLQTELVRENAEFKDIIQGSFIDDYRNMTYKHVMAFKWFLYNCPEAQVLVKVDDDVYVNTPQLIKYLKSEMEQPQPQMTQNQKVQAQPLEESQKERMGGEQGNENPTITSTNNIPTTTTKKSTKYSFYDSLSIFGKTFKHLTSSASAKFAKSSPPHSFNASAALFHRPQNLLFCQKIIGSLVKRSYRSKWRVGFKEYSGRYYPPYCPGYAIIYSPDVVFRLYTAAQTSRYFWIDDVHITGVLAQQTNTTITTSSHYVLYSDECERLLTGKTDLKEVEFLFAWHSISAQQIKALWHLEMMSLRSTTDLHYKKKRRREGDKDERLVYSISNYNAADGFR